MRFRHALGLIAPGALVLVRIPPATAQGFSYEDLKPWRRRPASGVLGDALGEQPGCGGPDGALYVVWANLDTAPAGPADNHPQVLPANSRNSREANGRVPAGFTGPLGDALRIGVRSGGRDNGVVVPEVPPRACTAPAPPRAGSRPGTPSPVHLEVDLMHLLTRRAGAAVTAAVATLLLTTTPALANVPVTEIGADTFTNATSQHRTQVEPDTFQFGTTIVAAQQTGRFFDGGSSDIAFATSTDNGATWTRGNLPGITTFAGGSFNRVSDPAVAFDSLHNVWMISTLGLTDTGGVVGRAVLTSRSTDGGLTWGNPVVTANATGSANLDKNWIACDNTAASPFFGRCYTEFDDNGAGNAVRMARSTNGGLSWTVVSTSVTGLGGQPVVRPNGTVLVPYLSNNNQIRSFRSIDGGVTWRASVLVSAVQQHTVAGGLRTSPLPSAEIDSAGTAYVAWQDCRFQSGCAGNDIVLSKSTSETTWGAVTRVTSDGGDHFIPGIGVDRTTSGGAARVAVTYYRYPVSACTAATCQLTVAATSSVNGGASWAAPTQIQGPMTLSWTADTSQGRMVGDYISTSVVPGGNAFAAFAVATAPTGGTFNENTFTVTGGRPVAGAAATARAADVPVATGEAVAETARTAR
ncbi:glycoside hydrolase [Actinomadura sp. ATCC 31491]|uniref:Glycoside hydrolase n=1 Tax=Actinomadura luzonensis TaxID=2805427 RepID=A0ABT0FTE5_9ACTN|nr:sialidase family protein [Actinomadura luzonensis]MCK2215586.1 glycoside hydrolase [Actinomadura luzonensis]